MNPNTRVAAVLAGLLVLLMFGRGSRGELPDNPKELLDLLKARDARFDNVHMSYIRRGVYTPDPFPYWKFPGQKPDAEPSKPMAFRFKEQIIFRGADTTFVRDVFTTPLAPSKSSTTFVSHQKWSDSEGLIREFLESKEYDDRSMTIKKRESTPISIVSEQRTKVEFSLGFGFGSRIKTISSFTRKGDQLLLQGSFQLWEDDVSRFRLSLGEDLVVRDAVIEVEAGNNQTRYDVSTEGSVKDGDFVFARTGHLQRTALGLKNSSVKHKVPFKPHITDEFYVDFKSAKFHLDDKEYQSLTTMEIPPGTHVTDYVGNKRYFVDNNNQVKKVSPLIPGGQIGRKK